MDLERTRRLQTEKKYGRLSDNPERGIAKRQFHVRPHLDLYLTALDLGDAFRSPVATPCLGRSQDIAWIKRVSLIELTSVETGILGSTIVKFPNPQVGGLILPPLADYYVNDQLGRTRRAGRYSRYQYVPKGANVRAHSEFRLFHPSDSFCSEHVITLHRLIE